MTIPATWEPLTDADPVLTIAQDLFSTMIDGEPGHLYPWMGENPALEDPRLRVGRRLGARRHSGDAHGRSRHGRAAHEVVAADGRV